MKRDSGKPPEQSGTARYGSWRRKQSVRPKCRQHWKEKSDNLEKRKEMKRVFMLVDFRIKPTENDVMMYEFLKYYNIPVTLVLTKVDKVSPSRREKNLKIIKNTIELAVGDDLVLFSSVNKTGRNDILKIIENLVIETI